jgi:hypothetical protein
MRRNLILLIAGFVLWAAPARAADDAAPLFTKLPDDAQGNQVYLFQIKKSMLSFKDIITGQQFCTKMNYGEAVAEGKSKSLGPDDKVVDVLDWVICRIPGRPRHEYKPHRETKE